MSDDGADLGVGAEKALEAVLWGGQPTEEDKQTVEQMRERILAAPIEDGASYDGCATACARIILEAFEKYPQLKNHPTECTYLCGDDGQMVCIEGGGAVPLTMDLHGVLKKLHPNEKSPERQVLTGLTGFMWGWAVNAARRCIGASPVPNPAIMTIGVSNETA